MAAANATVDGTSDLQNFAGVRVQLTGTWVGTVTFQSSVDGVNWASRVLTNSATGSVATTSTTNGVFHGDVGGRYFRLFMTAWTSGTATATIVYTAATATGASNLGIFLRAAASGDGIAVANVDEVALGAYNGTTIDRLINAGNASAGNLNKTLAVGSGTFPVISLNAAAAVAAGASFDLVTARPSHTLQVDVGTTTAGTAGTHTVRLEGSLDGANWTPLGTVSPASTSLTGGDPSNHAALSVTGAPWRYVRANWTAAPTTWAGTLTARVASA
jgi:hypothetical protein